MSLNESIDLSTPAGKTFAEYERSILSQRVKEGMAHAKKKKDTQNRASFFFDWLKTKIKNCYFQKEVIDFLEKCETMQTFAILHEARKFLHQESKKIKR